MAKIRVLHVTNRLEIGGTEKTLQIFCQYLDKSRFEVFACGRLGGGVRGSPASPQSEHFVVKNTSGSATIHYIVEAVDSQQRGSQCDEGSG